MPHDDSGHESLRILVIVSRPLDLRDLPNLADQWALQKGLQRVQAPVYLKMLRPPTVEAFRTEILGNYDIVHFDGHGDFGLRCKNCGTLNLPKKKTCERCEALLEGMTASGFLAFERDDGMQDALAAEEPVLPGRVRHKHRNLKRAYWALLSGFVPMLAAIICYLRLLDG